MPAKTVLEIGQEKKDIRACNERIMVNTVSVKAIVEQRKYDFLRTDEHIKDRLMFLTLGGSHAYGTNVEGSDIDIRGCALLRESDLLSSTNFEQLVDHDTDTTVYSSRKLISLLSAGNPNCIELLGNAPGMYAYLSDAGSCLLGEGYRFLSRQLVKSFGGYANQQLIRMENTIARERMDEDGQQDHLLKACQNAVDHFNEKYHDFPKNGIHLHIGVSPDDPAKKEILMDTDLSNFPIRDYSGMWHDLNELIKNFKKISSRPAIKEDAQINKYAMHIIRLYATLLDILEKGRVQTYRLEEHDTLMNIRNGAFMNADGLMRPEFYEMLEDYKQRVGYAKENTCLPDKPDYTAINELSVHIHRKAVEKK